MADTRLINRFDKKAWIMIKTALSITILLTATYLTIGLLNGFQWANHIIITNPIEAFFLISLPISLIPIYHQADNRLKKAAKQLGFTGLMIMGPSTITSAWYWFKPPTTGIERAIQALAAALMTASLFKLVGAVYFQKKNQQPT